MTNPDLAALSDAATKAAAMAMTELHLAVPAAAAAERFHRALAQAYRSGDLVLIDREGMRERAGPYTGHCITCAEATARAEAAEARVEVLEEALREIAPMVDWMPHPGCVSAEQIIRKALGGEHE